MKTILALLLVAILPLMQVRAATNDVHLCIELADGTYKEVRFTPVAGSALAFDTNLNPTATALSTTPAWRSADIPVTGTSLIAGTGSLLGKYTQSITFSTVMANVPEVTVLGNGLVTSGYAINVTTSGFTLVLPASVVGTLGYLAVPKQ